MNLKFVTRFIITIIVLLSLFSVAHASIESNEGEFTATSSFTGVDDAGEGYSVNAPTQITVTYTVTNNLVETAYNVTPYLVVIAEGNATYELISLEPESIDIPLGRSSNFSYTYDIGLIEGATTGGIINFSFYAISYGDRDYSTNLINDTVTVLSPSELYVTSEFSGVDDTVSGYSLSSPGEITVTYTVTNNSLETAYNVTPHLVVIAGGNATYELISPEPELIDISLGCSSNFTYTYDIGLTEGATNGGIIDFSFYATCDGGYSSNIVIDNVTLEDQLVLYSISEFSGVDGTNPEYSVGTPSQISVTYTVSNNLLETAYQVTPHIDVSPTGNATYTLVSSVSSPVDILYQESTQFTFVYDIGLVEGATFGGTLNFSFFATGQNHYYSSRDDGYIVTSNTVTDTLIVRGPPVLNATSSFSGVDDTVFGYAVFAPAQITVTYTVSNNLLETAYQVTPHIDVSPTGNVTYSLVSPVPSSVNIRYQESTQFTFVYDIGLIGGATSGGTIDFSFYATCIFDGEFSSNTVNDSIKVKKIFDLYTESFIYDEENLLFNYTISAPTQITIDYVVTNTTSETAYNVTPIMDTPITTEHVTCELDNELVTPVDISSGQSVHFSYVYTIIIEATTSENTIFFSFSVTCDNDTHSINSVEDIVAVETRASLNISSLFEGVYNDEGGIFVSGPQDITIKYTVENVGEADAINASPSMEVFYGGNVSVMPLTLPSENAVTIEGSTGTNSIDYIYKYRLDVLDTDQPGGTVTFSFSVNAYDENSGKLVPLAPESCDDDVDVYTPANLDDTELVARLHIISDNGQQYISGNRDFATDNQLITVRMSVTNTGETTATDLVPYLAVTDVTGTMIEPVLQGPESFILTNADIDLGSGETIFFDYTCVVELNDNADYGGTVTFDGYVEYYDKFDIPQMLLRSDAKEQKTLTVQTPVNIGATYELTGYYGQYSYHLGDQFNVFVTITNYGEATARPVAYLPGDLESVPLSNDLVVFEPVLTLSNPSSVQKITGPVPIGDNTQIAGGDSLTYRWTYRALSNGKLQMEFKMNTIDGNTLSSYGEEAVESISSEEPLSIQYSRMDYYADKNIDCNLTVNVLLPYITIGFTAPVSSLMTELNRLTGVLNNTWEIFLQKYSQFDLSSNQQILDMIEEYSSNVISLGNSFLSKTYLQKVIALINALEASL